MCGIAGLINFTDGYSNSIQQSLFHRGPDAQTKYKYKNLQLIHTRLSIQDIKHGEQPFEIGQYVIVFNGEIYNHLELRKELNCHTFKTNSDTETLLALYIKFGALALEMCDGMFAFAIFNKDKNTLILARDRTGKKPLYLYRKNKKAFFASELNTLLHSLPDLSIDEDAITAYIRSGFFFKETTPYQEVEEILPGHIYELEINSLKIDKSRYFDIDKNYDNTINISHSEAIHHLDLILHKSIKDRLISSELDVGAFLSSGIDSSLIVAIASQYVQNLKTFTVKFNGSYDESFIAGITAKRFSTNHHELEVSMDLKNDIEKIITSYGEPFMDSSAIPSFYISREAKKYLTVVLNGDGADELFGGYRRYVPIANNWINYAKYFSFLKSSIPNPREKQNSYNYIYRLLSMANKSDLSLYLSATNDIFEDVYSFKSNRTINRMEAYIKSVNKKDISELSKILIQDTTLILQSDLLKKMDIATMSNSLEARSPFLSKYILEWAPSLPDKEKVRGVKTKLILRDLAKKYSLNEVYHLPKKGFEVPLKNWVDNELRENIFDTLEPNCYSKSMIESNFINKLLNNKDSISREKRAKILWNLYSLEIWHKNYLNHSKSKVNFNETPQKNERKNILFLTTGLGLGGAERVVLDISNNIDLTKFNPLVIGVSSQKDLLPEFDRKKVHSKVLENKKTLYEFFKSLRFLFKFIKTNQINIIHSHMYHTIILSSIIKLFIPSIKVIFTPHNSFTSMRIRRLILWALKPFRDIDTIFSENARKFFHKQDYKVIANGIDIKRYSIKDKLKNNRPFTFVIVGRLEHMKNHAFLIRIASQIRQHDFQIKIVGSGLLEESLKSMVSDLNLKNKIQFLGARNDVPEILSTCDCLLLPSLWEAFPIVLLEAGASNIPVITTPVGSIPSLVNNENGYIVDLDNFKNAMIEVLENYSNATDKSLQLFKTVNSDYQIKDIVKKYEILYDSVLE